MKRLLNRKTYTVSFERKLKEDTQAYAESIGFNFSDYLSRLMIADKKRKVSLAHRVGRLYRPTTTK